MGPTMDLILHPLYSRRALNQGSGWSGSFGHGFYECRPEGNRRSRYAAERDEERVAEETRRVALEQLERAQQNASSRHAPVLHFSRSPYSPENLNPEY
ncbi:hypothetical protein F4805DRAFT_448630 [Annulohypoxylon moriforme]|nr:hypothetical protein F4805DRAFT_448630 [Annulohypoxylon moriforme]